MLEKIGEWLADEPKGRKNVPYIILYVFLALISGALILNFFIMMSAPIVAQTAVQAELKNIGPVMIFPILFAAAAFEELLFRLIPLAGAVIIFGRRPVPVLAVSVISSAVFGLLHGNFVNIFVQGTNGFLLSLLFLKCGGFNGKSLKGFATSSLGHFLFNGFIAISLIVSTITGLKI